jgi:sugar phosphate isomerase/epimerase
VDFAGQHGYRGIEVRGIQRQLDLTRSPEFSTEESRKSTMALMQAKGLQFVGLGSSANLHLAEGAEREKSLAGARAFIDLAQQIRCPYVRVFPNNFPKEQEKQETINLIVKGLVELGNYAKGKGVMVLMETHGDVVRIDDISTIMQTAAHPAVGLVWDVANMWTVTKEPPGEAYRRLKKYIRHTHIKDAKWVDGRLSYTLLGEGDVPVFEAIRALAKDGYKGYYSFEWEKLWHPEIAEPEIALAHYPVAIKKVF